MGQVITLHEANAVLTCSGPFKFNGSFDHLVYEMLYLFVLCVAIIENDCWW